MKFVFTAHTQKYKSILHGTGIANPHSSPTKPAPTNFFYPWTKVGDNVSTKVFYQSLKPVQ